MTVIKANHAGTMLKEAIVLDLGDIRKQAEALKASAQASAKRIVAEAEAKAVELTADARDHGLEQGRLEGIKLGQAEGLERGRAEALAKANAEIKHAVALWQQAAGEVEQLRAAIDRDARHAVLLFALRMAEKLVHRVIEVDDTVIVDQVATALSHVLHPVDVAVRIHPQDRAICDQAMPELLADFAHFKHIQLVDDPAVSAGGCVVNYGQGRVDAGIERQLQRIAEAMLPDGMGIADDSAGNDDSVNSDDAAPAAAAMESDGQTDEGQPDEHFPRGMDVAPDDAWIGEHDDDDDEPQDETEG